jgi:hypothetical protein
MRILWFWREWLKVRIEPSETQRAGDEAEVDVTSLREAA